MSSDERPALSHPLAGVFVLVVDDYDDARTLYATLLSLHGAQVTTAGSVAEAREAFERVRFDALVSDINMPEQDGIALIQWVRTQPADAGGRIPAVAITAHERGTHRELALDAGFNAFLGKPIDGADLVEALRRLLELE